MALTPMRGSNNQSLGRMHDWSTGWVHEDCYYIGLVLSCRACAVIHLIRAFPGATKCMEMVMSHRGIERLRRWDRGHPPTQTNPPR